MSLYFFNYYCSIQILDELPFQLTLYLKLLRSFQISQVKFFRHVNYFENPLNEHMWQRQMNATVILIFMRIHFLCYYNILRAHLLRQPKNKK